MPHAEEPRTQKLTMSNGEAPASKFIDHLTSYPVVSDSIEGVKNNPYGAKTIQVGNDAFDRFGKPILPYLRAPYSVAKPYVVKADALADSGLDKVETHFPIVKEKTDTVVDTTLNYVFWPIRYFTTTYNDEYKKTVQNRNRSPGYMTSAMALISTDMKMASDALQYVVDWLGPKKERAQQNSRGFVQQARQDGENLTQHAQQTTATYLQQARQQGDSMAQQTRQTAASFGQQARHEGDSAAQQTKQTANIYAQKAQEKTA